MICPSDPHQRNANAPKFEDRSQEETEWKEWCASEAAWKSAKTTLKLKEKDKTAFFSPSENWCLPAPATLKPEEREFVVDSGASMHMIIKKDLNSVEMDTLTKSCSPYDSHNSQWRSADAWRGNCVCQRIGYILDYESPRQHASCWPWSLLPFPCSDYWVFLSCLLILLNCAKLKFCFLHIQLIGTNVWLPKICSTWCRFWILKISCKIGVLKQSQSALFCSITPHNNTPRYRTVRPVKFRHTGMVARIQRESCGWQSSWTQRLIRKFFSWTIFRAYTCEKCGFG